MGYKVVYHLGENISVKTVVASGVATITDTELQIDGDDRLAIPLSDLTEVQSFRLHGLLQMVKVCHPGGTIFISVIRFRLFHFPVIGQFAVGNFFGAIKLFNLLRNHASAAA